MPLVRVQAGEYQSSCASAISPSQKVFPLPMANRKVQWSTKEVNVANKGLMERSESSHLLKHQFIETNFLLIWS